MPLRLKRTQAEEHDRARRRAYRAAKKEAKRKRAENHDERVDYEDTEFREKMWSALEDEQRLEGIDARFNDYAHIPDRWSRDAHDAANPQYMDDEEYAEWIRQGMWKKKHAREYEEQAKRDAKRAARRVREKEIKAETSRIERLARELEESRRKDRQRQREEGHRQRYEQRWKVLLDPHAQDQGLLTFADIPWPLLSASRTSSDNVTVRVEDITPEAITTFLLPAFDGIEHGDVIRRNRDKLKETLLRFHPDKFQGRFMHRVPASDAEAVREAVGQVARALNTLMSRQS